ncbi:unnamed protein product [Schistosoma curassoni]|uniref:Purinergic receptor n=1 Tax=Schistosoma curassoni TaxID=6186 RepID=A0A183JGB2_9TREM|nr:unnamed protein product [Schistosoma curassoni]
MPRVVHIRKPELAILHRFIQFGILTYFIIYVMWLKKGYQSFDRPISGVAVKVYGIAWKQIFKYQNPDTNGIIVLDNGDYLLQPTQNSGFYLITTIKHFVIQSMTTCSESDRLPDAICYHDNDCPIGYQAGYKPYGPDGIVPNENNIEIDESGHGIFTGKCLIHYNKCQIYGSSLRSTAYYGYDTELIKQRKRILIHVNGIQFIIRVNGIAGKFNLLSFTMKFGSGLALLSLSTIITDFILFYFTYNRKKYKKIICDDKTIHFLSQMIIKRKKFINI